MHLTDFFIRERQKIVDSCTACGMCAKICPIIPKTELAHVRAKEIQYAVRDFLTFGITGPLLQPRIQSCMQCYGCLDICPQDLNPFRALEICRWLMVRRGLVQYAHPEPSAADSTHRILASLQTTAQEYERISTPITGDGSEVLFFPGCNIYYQPEKLLNALDIMAQIEPGFSFLPGLDNCCGNVDLTCGCPEPAGDAFNRLMAGFEAHAPKTVVFWCPTCLCLAKKTFEPFTAYPFALQTMAQFISERLDRLALSGTCATTVTIHDACKVALTGLDRTGPRAIVRALGARIIEMPRSAETAACCGCAALTHYPSAGNAMLDERIEEARQTEADAMVTVCHFCSQVLSSRCRDGDLVAENYINLLARHLGHPREDTFRKYMAWGDPQRIMADAKANIAAAPFSRAQMQRTIEKVFCPPDRKTGNSRD